MTTSSVHSDSRLSFAHPVTSYRSHRRTTTTAKLFTLSLLATVFGFTTLHAQTKMAYAGNNNLDVDGRGYQHQHRRRSRHHQRVQPPFRPRAVAPNRGAALRLHRQLRDLCGEHCDQHHYSQHQLLRLELPPKAPGTQLPLAPTGNLPT